MNLTETEKAYLAGLFDGEGCVGYYKRGSHKGVPYHSASVHICMTDSRPVKWVMEKVGHGNISFSIKSGNRHNVYSWQLSHQSHVREFLLAIRPYLLLKADQVDLLFGLWTIEDELPKGHYSVSPSVVSRREELFLKMKQIKTVRAPEGVETRRAGSL